MYRPQHREMILDYLDEPNLTIWALKSRELSHAEDKTYEEKAIREIWSLRIQPTIADSEGETEYQGNILRVNWGWENFPLKPSDKSAS